MTGDEHDWRRAGIPELPDLTAREALNLVAVLHGLISQLWRCYGNDMAAAITEEGGGLSVFDGDGDGDTPDDDLF